MAGKIQKGEQFICSPSFFANGLLRCRLTIKKIRPSTNLNAREAQKIEKEFLDRQQVA